MKRLFILASAAIVALASCSKTQVVYNEAPEEIGFKAVTGTMTKAPLSGTALPTNQGDMMVYASQSATSDGTYEPSFGAAFTWKTSYWGGKDAPQYWPNSGFMKFMAYYPVEIGTPTVASNAVDGVTIEGIDIETSQTDILYTNLTTAQTCSGKPTVAMEFMHALAQIQVTAAVSDAAMDDVKITNVEIVTPNMGGDLSLSGSAASWDNETTMSGNFQMDNDIAATALTTGATPLGTGALVVPGNQTGLKITYTISGLENTVTKELTTGTPTWDQAKKYIYNIVVTLNEIKLSATVVDWTEPTPAVPGVSL